MFSHAVRTVPGSGLVQQAYHPAPRQSTAAIISMGKLIERRHSERGEGDAAFGPLQSPVPSAARIASGFDIKGVNGPAGVINRRFRSRQARHFRFVAPSVMVISVLALDRNSGPPTIRARQRREAHDPRTCGGLPEESAGHGSRRRTARRRVSREPRHGVFSHPIRLPGESTSTRGGIMSARSDAVAFSAFTMSEEKRSASVGTWRLLRFSQ